MTYRHYILTHPKPIPADIHNMKYVLLALFLISSNFDKPEDISKLQEITANNPKDWRTRLELVEIFINQKNFNDAADYIEQAENILAINESGPELSHLYYLRGLYHDLQDNIPGAYEQYEKSVAADSTNAKSWRKLGYLHELFSDGEQMLICFSRSLAHTEDSVGVLYDIGVAYDYMDSIDQAIDCYQKALALNDSLPEAYLNLGVDLGFTGHPDSALYYFNKAREYGLESTELYYNMGVIAFDNSQVEQAIENFMTVLGIDPHYSPAKMMLGNVYEAIGDSGMAKVYFEEFIDTAPLLYQQNIDEIKEKLEKHYR